MKEGMDKTELIIQCEHAGEKGHQCDKDTCGSLEAKGTKMHTTAIGNIIANRTVKEESGFSNLTIKGGIVNAQAGEHNCAIGAACGSYANGGTDTKQYGRKYSHRGRYHHCERGNPLRRHRRRKGNSGRRNLYYGRNSLCIRREIFSRYRVRWC